MGKEPKETPKKSSLADGPYAPTRDPILSLTATNRTNISLLMIPGSLVWKYGGVRNFNPLPTLLLFISMQNLRPFESLK
jgi:hypothetical protein